MMSYLIWPAALLLGWILVYFIWIRPLRAKLVAVVPEIVDAQPTQDLERTIDGKLNVVSVPPTAWQKFVAKVEGWKTIGLSLALSIFATVSSVIDVFIQDSSTLGDLQNVPWASFLKPDVALKIVSALLVIVPIFHMVGKVKAAIAEPVSTGSAKADG